MAAGRIVVLALAAAVTACSTVRPPASPGAPTAPSSSAPATRGGGYYQDDGPPAQVPADLAKVPDAVPRVEPPHRFANRPYVALGRNYTPLAGDPPLRQRGLASWYGRQFHGNRTSSGELYDLFAMSAAHPTMPIPSYARVTNLKTGASVIVRVNDRGPFKDDRIIDLSYAAATRLGYIATGTAEVQVERITNADIAAGRCCSRPPSALASAPVTAPASEPVAIVPSPASSPVAIPLPSPAATPGTPPTEVAGTAAPPTASAARWSVQVGAFSQAANAHALRERVAVQFEQSAEPELVSPERAPRVEQDGAMFRVLVGALPDRAAALQLAARLERLLARETVLFLR